MDKHDKLRVAALLRSLALELEADFLPNASFSIDSKPKISGSDGGFLTFDKEPESTSVTLFWSGGFPCLSLQR